MERRKFIKLTGLGATGLSLHPLWESLHEEQSIYSFPQMVGEISQTSAILQTRLAAQNKMPDSPFDTPEVLVSQDIPGVPGVGRFEIADNARFDGPKKTPWLAAKVDQDCIIKHKIQDLKPHTHYYMRVRFGSSTERTQTGPVSQFMTLPVKDSETPVSFVVSSCMNLAHFFLGHHADSQKEAWLQPTKGRDRKLGYRVLEAIENLNPTFWVQTGDNVYYDHPMHAKTKDELRAHWRRQMALPRMHRLLQKVPVYFMKDDHDFRYNDSDDQHNGERPSAELGIATFREQVPVVDPKQKEAVTYRSRQINKFVQIWMPEGRDYRDANTRPDGPNKSIWGEKQFKWLKKSLLASEAIFKLLIVPSPLVGPDDAYKHDNHTNYGGFQHERDQFFQWLKTHEFLEKNFYIITGDRHWQYHSIHPSGFEEFGTGTLTEQNSRYGRKPGDPDSTDPLGLITQPYIQEQPTAGFISVRVAPPGKDRPALLTFTTLDKNGNELYVNTKRAT